MDEEACRIQVFSLLSGREGTYLRQWGRQGEFTHINAIVVHRGEVIVTDSGWDQTRVQAFTPEGVYLRQWGSGELVGSITHLSITRQGEIAVVDLKDHRIQIFSLLSGREGVLLRQWQHRESLTPASDIIYLTDDTIAILDSKGPRVQIFRLCLR